MIERDIKAALVDRLIKRGDLSGDAVLVNEMAVASKERRADLVIANGKLQAFEIKSDADKLDRLVGQVNTYREYFDKVTVVCGSKYVKPILETTSSHVEVWVVVSAGPSIRWKVARRGVTEPVSDREKLLSFMPKKDAIRALRSTGICCSWDTPRAELIHWAENMSIKALKSSVLAYVKSRHSEVNARFMKRRGSCNTKPIQLQLLSLYRETRSAETNLPMFDAQLDNDEQARAAAHPSAIDITKLKGAKRHRGSPSPIYIIPKG